MTEIIRTAVAGPRGPGLTAADQALLQEQVADATEQALLAQAAAASINDRAAYDPVAEPHHIFADNDDKALAWIADDGMHVTGRDETVQDTMRTVASLDAASSKYLSLWTFNLPDTALAVRQGPADQPIVAFPPVGPNVVYTGITLPTIRRVSYTGLPAGQNVRDPSVRQDPLVSRFFWMAHSAHDVVTGPDKNSWAMAFSPDGLTWEHIADVPGVDGALADWAPELHFDPDGRAYVIISHWFGDYVTAPDGTTQVMKFIAHLYRATDSTNTTFDNLGPMTGAMLPQTNIDMSITKIGDYYYGIPKDEAARQLIITRSTSLQGPYDTGRYLNELEVPVEGGQLVLQDDGSVRLYYDRYFGEGLCFSDAPSIEAAFTGSFGPRRIVNVENGTGGLFGTPGRRPRHGTVLELRN